MMHKKLVSSGLFSIRLLHLVSAQSCYYYGGDPAAGDAPCFPDQSSSGCCGPGYDCTNIGTCVLPGQDPIESSIRGSCTDASWSSDSDCPQYCTGGGGGSLGYLAACDDDETQFYCASDQAALSAPHIDCDGNGIALGTLTDIGAPPPPVVSATSYAPSSMGNSASASYIPSSYDPTSYTSASYSPTTASAPLEITSQPTSQQTFPPVVVSSPTTLPTSSSVPISSQMFSRISPSSYPDNSITPSTSSAPATSVPTVSAAPLPVTAASSVPSALSSAIAPSTAVSALAGQSTAVPTPVSKSTSSAAAIGGGVGGGIAALLLAALGFFLWRRHNKRKERETDAQYRQENDLGHTPDMGQAKSEPYSPPPPFSEVARQSPYSTADRQKSPVGSQRPLSSTVHEISHQHTGESELDGRSPAAEMYAGHTTQSELDGRSPATEMYAGMPPAELPANEPWKIG